MTWFGAFYRSAVGKKAVMGLSGIGLFGFVASHMAGNLKAFQGAEKFNTYAEFLREMGSPILPHGGGLWLLRAGLLVALALHVHAAVALTRMNLRARPESYERLRGVQLDYAARTMRWSGFIVLFWVIYHLMHFTWGNAHREFIPGDAFHNLVTGFSFWPIAVVYMIAVVLVGIHLFHGLWSMFQSLGWNHPRYNAWRRPFAVAFAVIVTLGFLTIPLGVLAGVIS